MNNMRSTTIIITLQLQLIALFVVTSGHVLPDLSPCRISNANYFCSDTEQILKCDAVKFCQEFKYSICAAGPKYYCKVKLLTVYCGQEELCAAWLDDGISVVKVWRAPPASEDDASYIQGGFML